ncbi:MAG: hypothetical protein BGO77_02270 [Caedibacter sp. 37-49]|nr:MAG: hypothetical protein BGO77_02270 [Caedibacter sp. 37-49]
MRFSKLFLFCVTSVSFFSINLMASSDFNEIPPKGYKAPHASMLPGLTDSNSPKEFDRFALQNRLVQVENQQIVLEGISEPKEKAMITSGSTNMTSAIEKENSRSKKLKLHKDKKTKKPTNNKKKQEKIINTVIEASTTDDDSRPQTMIIKYTDENDLKALEKLTLQEERNLPIKKLPSRKKTKATVATASNKSSNTNIVDELIGTQKQHFKIPPRLDTWELLLILLAGNQKEKGMTYKVHLYDRNMACNYKSLLQGQTEDDLVPFLQLDQFRKEPSLLTLREHLIIRNQDVKRKFSNQEIIEIEDAKEKLQRKIDSLYLSEAGAKLIADEKREHSTLANCDSLLVEYQLTEGQYSLDKVVLSLTLYFQK